MSFSTVNWLLIVVGYLLAFFTSLHIVLQRREPTATMAWILGIVLIPYLGVLVYVLIGRRRLNRQLRRRRAQATAIEPRLASALVDDEDLLTGEQRPMLARAEVNILARLSSRVGCRWPTVGNKVTLIVDAEQTYAALEQAIEAAQHHVHFQFYIFQPDDTGRRFRELLVRKARAGVQVRVLTDGVGSWGIEDFLQPLVQVGGQHAQFQPVGRLSRHWHPNLRNHRKVVVVDGSVAFAGGCNIGDEYTGRRRPASYWRDTHLRIEGPAVTHVQEVFADDWFFAAGEEPDERSWFPENPARGEAMVHIVASGPDSDPPPIQRIFFAAVSSATERIYLTTPYFAPDQALLMALETAAMRGVDVRLLLPQKSDAPLILHAGRSYYQELLGSGIRIYEYERGILHAKTMVVDRTWATVGSANMDMRSFRLNFEINAAIYGAAFADQLTAVFEHDLRLAHEIRSEELRNKPPLQQFAESLARILSPML